VKRSTAGFVAGALVVLAGHHLAPSPRSSDPLPDRGHADATIRVLARQANGLQRVAFTDGRIDRAEYQAAVAERVRCVEDQLHDVDVRGSEETADGRLLSWRYRVPGGPSATLADVDSRCAAGLSAQIERAWALEVLPQGTARRREVAHLAACLTDHGVALRGSGLKSVLAAAGGASVDIGDCVRPHAVLFGL
jgi:hypothetical protein